MLDKRTRWVPGGFGKDYGANRGENWDLMLENECVGYVFLNPSRDCWIARYREELSFTFTRLRDAVAWMKERK